MPTDYTAKTQRARRFLLLLALLLPVGGTWQITRVCGGWIYVTVPLGSPGPGGASRVYRSAAYLRRLAGGRAAQAAATALPPAFAG